MGKLILDKLLYEVSLGSEDAFIELYNLTNRGIYALIYPYFKNHDDVLDALQEIYLLIKDKAHLYKRGTNARAWIFELAKNTSLNLLAKEQREKRKITKIELNYQEKDNNLEANTLLLTIEKCLDKEEYEIVILHVLMRYKHKEISKLLKKPLGTITTKYQKAINKLREELKDEEL